jgi:hypothetical protein
MGGRMDEAQVIKSYWIGLHRTKNQGKHLHNFYRELFGQPFYKANLTGMYRLVKDFDAEIVFKSITDLLEWQGFVPTRNIIPALRHVVQRRYEHNQVAENQPEMVDLTDYMKGLANVR